MEKQGKAVIVSKNGQGVVDISVYLPNPEESAEEFNSRVNGYFVEKCSEYISNWDEYSIEDKILVSQEGYESFGTGNVNVVDTEVYFNE